MERPRVDRTARPRINRGIPPLSAKAERLIAEAPAATPNHVPTEKSRYMVREMACFGFKQDHIGKLLGVSGFTIAKYYPDELATAEIEGNMVAAGEMYKRMQLPGKEGLIANIFWLKARAGWRDQDSKLTVSGPNDGPIKSEVSVGEPALTNEERAIRLLQILASGNVIED